MRFLHEHGLRVVTVPDRFGAVADPRGLDPDTLDADLTARGTIAREADPDGLLELDVDVLVPAAIEGVLHTDIAPRVRARVVVEGANGPTTPEADTILAAQGTLVVPDILANASGVIVPYFERVQANQTYWWSHAEVESRLEDRMLDGWCAVTGFAAEHALSLRTAATTLAVERVADALRLRGLYP